MIFAAYLHAISWLADVLLDDYMHSCCEFLQERTQSWTVMCAHFAAVEERLLLLPPPPPPLLSGLDSDGQSAP